MKFIEKFPYERLENDGVSVKEALAWLEKQGELVNSLSKGLDNAHERIDGLIQKNNELCIKLEKQGEQEPAWSEEDKKEYKYVLKFVDNILNNCDNDKDYEHCKRCYDWLKSLKQRIGG